MTGNDIIDRLLAAHESNWKRKGWLVKLFTEAERELIDAGAEPDAIVWLLWSMKESAYKIWNRLSMQRCYQPQQFRCRFRYLSKEDAEGFVAFGTLRIHTRTIITADFLHTIASLQNNWDRINVYIGKPLAPGAQRPVYRKDAQGLPYIPGVGAERAKPASVSHHGRYEAIVY